MVSAQDRQLHWPSISVEAHLDSTGRLHIRERQVMQFTGAWNGGERSFNVRHGQKLSLDRMSRVDSATGALRPMNGGSLDNVDDFDWTDSETLRWRSRR